MEIRNVKWLSLGSFLFLVACGGESSIPVNAPTGDIGNLPGQVDPCNGLTPMVGDDGSIYCVDANGGVTPIIGGDSNVSNPDVNIPQVCLDEMGNSVSQGVVLNAIDGSTYMYNGECQKVVLSTPASSASVDVYPENPASSAEIGLPQSSSELLQSLSSAVFESESNGNAPVITYGDAGASVSNDNGCVSVTGGEVVITCAGDYDFSGSYKGADAQIRVYSPKADSGVYLNLRGLTLENTVDAPIYVQMASKAFVVAKKETINKLSDGATRTKSFTYTSDKGESKVDTTGATIYSKDDLTIKGAGTLIVNGNYNNGVQCSNDLRFRGETTLEITAKNNGLKGKGKVDVENGIFTITTTEGDGIKSDECVVNSLDSCIAIVEGKGIVKITGGTITIKAGDDGIQAFNTIRIDESNNPVSIKITAGDGQPDKDGSGFGGPGGGGHGGGWGWFAATPTDTEETSNKGIVGGDSVIIDAGTIEVASHKDAVHSNGYVTVNGGNLKLAGRNGIHADEIITINDGVVYVTESFEALEARQIIAKGGVTASESTNDGWNAGTGNEGCTGDCKIEVTGGVHYMHIGSGDTDGMDSNQSLFITGGVVVVECEMSGGQGGSFDAERTGTTSITSKTVLGFSKSRSEEGTSYSVSFNTNGYYGNANIAFKPTTSGSYIQATSQPAAVSNVNSYAKNTVLPNGLTIYYNN